MMYSKQCQIIENIVMPIVTVTVFLDIIIRGGLNTGLNWDKLWTHWKQGESGSHGRQSQTPHDASLTGLLAATSNTDTTMLGE